ncbi:dynein 1b light intermediate chain [Plasmopara halstedii]|uniref:Cytoplasmic dynein 2 light intermediate chain 1 n=1 Tax=Plasmopara halstedii TaxID=4781 RepID=A0A0P1AFE2_PLAHL|nr:dynein 1b light intermediate chain [Plasmopara halstedii]CEG39737.1 dynein 1b light intermediate chain [Plasmopara halstedii]|eukprot:XP_024576106.1 dynein 1b light intermediate chain [Plasmopara halstedii]
MPIITFVARVSDGMLLVASMESIGDANGNLDTYKQQAKQIMKRLDQRSPTKCSVESGAYTFQRGGNYWRDVVTTVARPYAFIKFDKYIQKKRKEYADPSSSQNMHRLNDDLADIHNIMRKNIQEVLNRGERVEHVSRISSNLADRSKDLKWGAKKLRMQAIYRQYGPIVAVVLFVLLVIYIKVGIGYYPDEQISRSTVKTMTSKDIWSILSTTGIPTLTSPEFDTIEKPTAAPAQEERDTFTLIVGPRGSGKSSLVAAFRNSSKAEEIKPTTALDYVFVRLRSAGRPAVAHMWELASTKCLGEMIRVPLGLDRILNGALLIVLDLSIPGDVIPALVKWLTTLYAVVHEILKIKEKNPVDKLAVDTLRNEAMARYGNGHPDKNEVTPLLIPVLVIGNKYETFRDEDSIKRKAITQAIRYVSHMYGASVLFTSVKDKNLVTHFRSIMKGFAFRTMGRGMSKEVDLAKPLWVPAGADLFEDIGVPKSAGWRQDRFTNDQHEEKARQWIKVASEYYQPSEKAAKDLLTLQELSEQDDKDIEGLSSYVEPNIDRARQQKREELRRYRNSRQKAQGRKTRST